MISRTQPMNTNPDYSGMETPAAKSETLPTRFAKGMELEWKRDKWPYAESVSANDGTFIAQASTPQDADKFVIAHNAALRMSHGIVSTTTTTLTQNK